MRASGEDLSKLKMLPKEQDTKLNRMLKDMKSYLDGEKERRAKMRAEN